MIKIIRKIKGFEKTDAGSMDRYGNKDDIDFLTHPQVIYLRSDFDHNIDK